MEYIFKDVLDIKNGKNQREVECPDGQYPIYGSGGVMGYANDYICEADTVIIGRKGSINNPIYAEEPFWNVDTAFGLCAKKDILLPKYLFYFCIKFDFERLNRTVTIPSLTKSDLLKIKIQVPSLDVQQEVIDKLTKIESILNFRKQELKLLDELVRGRFVELFGDISKFKSVALKENVEEMFIGPFGSALKNECFVGKDDAFCMVYEQKHAIQKNMDVPTRYVDEEKYNQLKRFSIHGGDIIVSCRGTIGEIYSVPEDAPLGIMHPSIMKIRLKKDKYCNQFFVYMLEKYMQDGMKKAKGSGVKMAVTAKELGEELFVVPTIEQQIAFEQFVHQIDKSKFRGLSMLTTMKSAYEQQALIYS